MSDERSCLTRFRWFARHDAAQLDELEGEVFDFVEHAKQRGLVL